MDLGVLTINRFMGSMPLSALFILFDFVVHNPTHPETKNNLSLLGVAAGYFCRLEYASKGSLPSSLLSDFAAIARQYVDDLEASANAQTEVEGVMDMDPLSMQPTMANMESRNPSSSIDSVSFTQPSIERNFHKVASRQVPINPAALPQTNTCTRS